MSKKTRDNIYDYIHFTDLEAAITRHPLFLRLHYIHQNSFTFLTYPTAHMQRHPHSLGVMHLAGEMFKSAILNTKDNEIISLLRGDVDYTLKTYDIDISEAETEIRQNLKIVSSQIVFRDIMGVINSSNDESQKFEEISAILIIYQAIRIAALMHDIGHPPFSHIVEYGLQDALNKVDDDSPEHLVSLEYDDHEKTGLSLSEIIFEEIADNQSIFSNKFSKAMPIFSEACFRVCQDIISNENSVFSGIYKTVLAGDIDADRLDYVRRDIESIGFATTSYDTGRLLSSLFLKKSSQNDNKIVMAISPSALSAVETFFSARFHLYRWALFHHDVARRNLCMQRFVYTLARSTSLPPIIQSIRDEFLEIACSSDKKREYGRFIDGYFIDLLWKVHNYIKDNATFGHDDLKNIFLFTDLVLNRNNNRLKTLWKRPDEYESFCRRYFESTEVSSEENIVEKFNGKLREIFDKSFSKKYDKKLGRFKFAQALEKAVNKDFPIDGVKIYIYYIAAFKAAPDEEFRFYDQKGGMEGISFQQISPALASLETAWQRCPQIMCYFSFENDWQNDLDDRVRNEFKRVLKNAIIDLNADADKEVI